MVQVVKNIFFSSQLFPYFCFHFWKKIAFHLRRQISYEILLVGLKLKLGGLILLPGLTKQPGFLRVEDLKNINFDPRGGGLCVEMGFYADTSWESRCNIEINV